MGTDKRTIFPGFSATTNLSFFPPLKKSAFSLQMRKQNTVGKKNNLYPTFLLSHAKREKLATPAISCCGCHFKRPNDHLLMRRRRRKSSGGEKYMDTYVRARKSLSLASSHPGEGGGKSSGTYFAKKKCGGAQCQIWPTFAQRFSLT